MTAPHVVLLVDDQLFIGETLRAMLAGADDIRLHVCTDPGQALAMAIELRPTVILQDLIMPGVDGLMLLKFYRVHPATRATPLVVLSSREDPATKERAFALGAHDYLVKLPHATELLARLRHHSGSHLARVERDRAFAELKAAQDELAEEVASAGHHARRLLPPFLTGTIEASYLFEPSLALGGDMLGYHRLDEHRLAFYVLDVVGHGVRAALHGVAVATVLRSQLIGAELGDPAAALAALNRAFASSEHGGHFFSIWYGVHDARTGQISFATAGHPAALLVLPSGELRELGNGGPMVGLVPEVTFEQSTAEAPPGSRLYVFSDGAYEIESPRGQLWSEASFQQALVGCQGALESFFAACRAFRGAQLDDDCTVLHLRFLTAPSPASAASLAVSPSMYDASRSSSAATRADRERPGGHTPTTRAAGTGSPASTRTSRPAARSSATSQAATGVNPSPALAPAHTASMSSDTSRTSSPGSGGSAPLACNSSSVFLVSMWNTAAWPASSPSVRGVPRAARYAGDATITCASSPSLRCAKVPGVGAPMRMARSTPACTRSMG